MLSPLVINFFLLFLLFVLSSQNNSPQHYFSKTPISIGIQAFKTALKPFLKRNLLSNLWTRYIRSIPIQKLTSNRGILYLMHGNQASEVNQINLKLFISMTLLESTLKLTLFMERIRPQELQSKRIWRRVFQLTHSSLGDLLIILIRTSAVIVIIQINNFM